LIFVTCPAWFLAAASKWNLLKLKLIPQLTCGSVLRKQRHELKIDQIREPARSPPRGSIISISRRGERGGRVDRERQISTLRCRSQPCPGRSVKGQQPPIADMSRRATRRNSGRSQTVHPLNTIITGRSRAGEAPERNPGRGTSVPYAEGHRAGGQGGRPTCRADFSGKSKASRSRVQFDVTRASRRHPCAPEWPFALTIMFKRS
jgi:hypothetical protein